MGLLMFLLTKGVTTKKFNYIIQAYAEPDDYIGTYSGTIDSDVKLSVLMAESMIIRDLREVLSRDTSLSVSLITNENHSYQFMKTDGELSNIRMKPWRNSNIFTVLSTAIGENPVMRDISRLLDDYRNHIAFNPSVTIYTDATIDEDLRIGAYAVICTRGDKVLQEETIRLDFDSKESSFLCEDLGISRALELADTVYSSESVLIINDCKDLVCSYQILRRKDSRVKFKWKERNSLKFLSKADKNCGKERRKK